MHKGIDFAAPLGTGIYAAADGEVIEGAERSNVSGFGNWTWTRHTIDGQVVDVICGHMYQSDIVVRKGDRVTRGQFIAKVGNNGDSSGPHLHFEVWTGGSAPRLTGSAVDPAPWFVP